MRLIAGYSSRGMLRVQSVVSDTTSIGLGANMAAISTLLVLRRRPGAFSHRSPPCMMDETMFTGDANWMRSSIAVRRKVCVAPPDAPAMPIRLASTSSREERKSKRANRVPQLEAMGPNDQRRCAALAKRCGTWTVSVIAYHVVSKDDVALLGQADPERRTGVDRLVLKPAILPMSMRIQDRRMLCLSHPGADRDCRPDRIRQSLDEHFFNCVALPLDFPKICGWSGVFSGIGDNPADDQNLIAQKYLSLLPCFQACESRQRQGELVVMISVLRASCAGGLCPVRAAEPPAHDVQAMAAIRQATVHAAQPCSTRS